MPFTTISQGVELLDHRNRRLNLRRISLHADLLNQRHSEGPIADFVAMTDFTAADLFLHLRAAAGAGPNSRGWDWRPWSLLYLNQPPRFLHNLTRTKEAEELLEPLGVRDLEHLRSLLAQRLPQLAAFYEQDGLWHNPLATFDSSVVGTR